MTIRMLRTYDREICCQECLEASGRYWIIRDMSLIANGHYAPSAGMQNLIYSSMERACNRRSDGGHDVAYAYSAPTMQDLKKALQ